MSNSIDVAGLVSQLMAVERAPVDLLTARQTTIKKKADALEGLKNLVTDIGTKAGNLDLASEWNLLKASSSNSAVSTSVAATGGFSGSMTFTVTDLATSQKLYSSSTLASTSTQVSSADHLLVASGAGSMGMQKLAGSLSLALGAHKVEVTQASSAAVKTGPWPTSAVTIDDSNNEMVIELNGMEYHVVLDDADHLAHDDIVGLMNTSFTNAGVGDKLKASLAPNGDLQLATTAEGSANTLQVTGGSALAALGLSVDASAIAGTDAKVKVGEVETTLADIRAGGAASLAAAAGSIDVTFAGGLRTGSTTAKNVDLGDGSLSAVVSAINNAGGDVTASAIKVGEGAYRLQLQSKNSGVNGRMNIDQSLFDGIGPFSVLTAGSDAKIQLTGDNPITITSSSNTFSDVLPGVSFTLNSKPTDPVTVTATRDQDTLTARIQSMIDSVNRSIGEIKVKMSWDSTSKIGGALSGDYSIARLQQSLRSAVTGVVETGGSLTQAGQVGITLTKEGNLAFDKTKFLAAYNADPAAVQRVFVSEAGDPDPGITQRLADAVKKATDFTSGTLSTAAASQRNRATDITKSIDRWEDRLLMRQATLTRQFTNLNTALGSLGNQSQWLAGQIAGLPTG